MKSVKQCAGYDPHIGFLVKSEKTKPSNPSLVAVAAVARFKIRPQDL